jgi:hypothetical protein
MTAGELKQRVEEIIRVHGPGIEIVLPDGTPMHRIEVEELTRSGGYVKEYDARRKRGGHAG